MSFLFYKKFFMLKRILFLLFLTISIKSYAQSGFGIKAGANYSTLIIQNSTQVFGKIKYNPYYKYGYHLGLYNLSEINKRLLFRTEVLFSDSGFSFSDDILKKSSFFHFYYLRVPMLFEYKFVRDFDICFGIDLGHLMSTGNGRGKRYIYETKIFNRYDFGLSGGFEYRIFKSISAGVRYTQSLFSMDKPQYENDFGELRDKSNILNKVFRFSISFLII